MSPAWGLPKEPDTVTELPPWRASPAHHRAVALGALGAVVAVVLRRPDVLVLVTPFLVIATWGVQSGPDASLGQDWMNSVAIAADDRNNEFDGHPIQIVTEDGYQVQPAITIPSMSITRIMTCGKGASAFTGRTDSHRPRRGTE